MIFGQPAIPPSIRTTLREQIELAAPAHRIYQALLDAKQFASFSRRPATIDAKPGGESSLFGGTIEARILELVPDRRIVEAWRSKAWEPGQYSIVRFDLKESGHHTEVTLEQKGFPEGEYSSLGSGWERHYWRPLKTFLAKAQ